MSGTKTSKKKSSTEKLAITPDNVDFVIMTVLDEERNAVCKAFSIPENSCQKVKSKSYWFGKLNLPQRGDNYYKIAVAQCPDMANVDSAIRTVQAIYDLKPKALILVGIAGAAGEDVQLGDIAIGEEIHYYERGKVTPSKTKPEPKILYSDPTLVNAIISLKKWKPRFSEKKPNGSSSLGVHRGVIFCGEKVIASNKVKKLLLASNRKGIAIDMECYGFCKAILQSAKDCNHITIKAISDKADKKKNDDWHPYASTAAAYYAKHFLLSCPIDPISNQIDKPKKKSKRTLLEITTTTKISRSELEAINVNICAFLGIGVESIVMRSVEPGSVIVTFECDKDLIRVFKEKLKDTVATEKLVNTLKLESIKSLSYSKTGEVCKENIFISPVLENVSLPPVRYEHNRAQAITWTTNYESIPLSNLGKAMKNALIRAIKTTQGPIVSATKRAMSSAITMKNVKGTLIWLDKPKGIGYIGIPGNHKIPFNVGDDVESKEIKKYARVLIDIKINVNKNVASIVGVEIDKKSKTRKRRGIFNERRARVLKK